MLTITYMLVLICVFQIVQLVVFIFFFILRNKKNEEVNISIEYLKLLDKKNDKLIKELQKLKNGIETTK